MLRRLQTTRAFRTLVFLLAASLFAVSLRYAWLAFTNPVELEIREGSVWIHVLAKQAGVDIYDSTRVAFVNMNHGPMDPILKSWLAQCAPWLPGHMVTRSFVLLFPIVLLGTAYAVCHKNLTAALLAAASLYLFFTHISSMLLVGRSDATALCGTALCGVLVHQLLTSRHREWSNKSYVARQVAFGAASAFVFLTSWRFAPVIAAFQFVVLAKQVSESRVQYERKTHLILRTTTRIAFNIVHLVTSFALFTVGFLAVWLPTFVIELHGSIQTYYQRFFGFFTPKSGWGTFAGREFHLFPSELVEPRRGLCWLFVLLILLGLYRIRRERAQLVAWIISLSSLWVTVSYGYFKNEGGGGLHYFFEFFIFAWVFVLHSFHRRHRLQPLTLLAAVGIFAIVRPWNVILEQTRQVEAARERAVAFKREVAALTRGRAIYGEETHLFKTKYRDEVIDTGDTAAVIAGTGYYGADFDWTYQSYTTELLKRPPRFVLAGLLDEGNWIGVMTPALNTLLKQQYQLVSIVHGSSFAYGGSQALFARKPEYGGP